MTLVAALISALAFIVSVPVIRRLQEPRLLFLPLMLGVLSVRVVVQVVAPADGHVNRIADETITLAASVISLVFVLALGRVVGGLLQEEQDLKAQKGFLESVIDALPHPFCVIDAHDRKVLLANSIVRPHATDALPTCFSVTHGSTEPCRGPEHPCPIQEVVETGRPTTVEHVHTGRNGEKRYWELHGFPLFGERREVSKVIAYSLDATDRKLAEEAIRTAERRFWSAFENALQGLYVADPNGRITMANKAMARILGLDAAEDLITRLANVDHIPYLRDSRRREITELLQKDDEVRGIESQMRRLDGKTVWVSENVRVVRDDDGIAIATEGVLVDITEWKEMERALGRALERLAMLNHIERSNLALTGSGPIALAAVEGVVSVTHADMAFVVRFDLESEKAEVIAAESSGDFWPAQGDTVALRAFAEEWEANGPAVRCTEDLTVVQDRSPILQILAQQGVRSVLRARFGVEGQPMGEMVTAAVQPAAFSQEDLWVIQEAADALAIGLHQARLRETLSAERERLRLTLDALPDGVILLDHRGEVLLANPTAQLLLPLLQGPGPARPLDAMGGHALWDLASMVGPSRWTELSFRGTVPQILEVLVDRIVLDHGLSRFVVVLRDITKERDVERQLRLQERLAGIGQLAAGVAHDFNNLLQGIEMEADRVLMAPGLSDAIRQAEQAIVARARRGAGLIRQILDFSRTAAPTKVSINLRELLEEHFDLLKRTIPENIVLGFEYPPDDFWIEGDATQIQEAVTNLAINARDAMQSGGELRVTLGKVAVEEGSSAPVIGMPAGEWVRLSVCDTGTGIPAEIQPRVFEPFFTTKKPGEGTGLGLSQVYGVVKRHGGFVELTCQPGEGASFFLYFPLANNGASLAPAADSTTEECDCGCGEPVLVVEDDQELLGLITSALNNLGYRAVGTSSGGRALDLYLEREEPFALVLSDLVMPGLSGLELAAKLGVIAPEARVLIMSGYPDANDLGPQHVSVAGWITKPFSTEDLGRAVKKALHEVPQRPVGQIAT